MWDKNFLFRSDLYELKLNTIYVKSDIDTGNCSKLIELYVLSQNLQEIDGNNFAVWVIKR